MISRIIKVYIIAAFLGAIIGVMASLLQYSIAKVDGALDALYSYCNLHYPGAAPFICVAVTICMVLTAWMMVYFIAPEASGSGVQEMEGALLRQRPIFWKRLLPVKFFAGILALSAKMVVGREGPTIQIGGNLGKMLSEFFRLAPHRADSLIAAGSAAGLAAAFNAPLAGILFVMEEMRNKFNYSFVSFKMVAIACAVATIVTFSILGVEPAIKMEVFDLPSLGSLWFFVLFGIVIGLVGLLFNKTLMFLLKRIDQYTFWQKFLYVLLVGLIIGILSYYYRSSVGGGYAILSSALNSSLPSCEVLCILVVVRFLTTMASYSTGVPGGIFAPMLALGTLLGLLMFHIFNCLIADFSIYPGVFAVAGMGALFAATVRAPVTGVILVVEMTQNYSLILPLMITCIISTTIMQIARNKPIYTQLLQRTLKLNKAKLSP